MDLQALQSLALDVASARCLDLTLGRIVDGLADAEKVALARIWLIKQGEDCDSCAFRSECPQEVDCLHLVASAGRSQLQGEIEWDQLDGRFRRFPMNVRKVGHIGGTGEALRYDIDDSEQDWIANPAWAENEGIRSFAGQPLVFRGETLGVLALFYRDTISEDEFRWLRLFADQAAVAIANSRAFEEVESLREQLELERDYLREERKVAHRFEGLVGESEALRQIERQVEAVAPTEANVLIQGESGTGKELIATAIHERSARAKKPMVHVNCAAIPRELFESEFFGHAKGSFTGALRERAGRFQIANGGTLFLDEIGEIPLELQGKLLRVLQEGRYSRVGEDSLLASDVRVVAATNRCLKDEVAAGQFREDLFYRLSVFPILSPPLRERPADILPLALHFLETRQAHRDSAPLKLSQRNVRDLQAYSWPGNVRELQNVIERAAILSRGGRLQFTFEGQGSPAVHPLPQGSSGGIRTEAEMRADERANTLAALEACQWRISGPRGAAALLDIKPTTLRSRLAALGIDRPGRVR